jgi:hypothetical protein
LCIETRLSQECGSARGGSERGSKACRWVMNDGVIATDFRKSAIVHS